MPSQGSTRSAGLALLAVLAGLTLQAGAAFAQAQFLDQDGDGWTPVDGDSADVVTARVPHPEWVNPGAYDIPGNNIDDDCDGIVDNTVLSCSSSAIVTPAGSDLAAALDLCHTALQSPPVPYLRRWGVISAALSRANGTGTPGSTQTGVLPSFGPVTVPQAGATMAVLSTGSARAVIHPGYVPPTPGLEVSLTAVPMDATFTTANGGLYHAPGCPQGSNNVYDSVRLRLVLRVPTNAYGLRFSHRYYASEYPNQCSDYNDHFVVLLSSIAQGIPANHNIAYDAQANPLTAQTAHFTACAGCPEGTSALANTGYDDDGATGWVVTTAPVVGGETAVLDFHVFDVGDGLQDALAVIDHFQWITHENTAPLAVGDAAAIGLQLVVGPNPTSGRTHVRFTMPVAARVTADLLDAAGRRVRRLADDERAAGPAQIAWDGLDETGSAARPGLYFVRLRVGEATAMRAIVLRH